MEGRSKNKLKVSLLFVFVITSILLVFLIWAVDLLGIDGDANPAFVRPTFDNILVDDDAYENWNQAEVTETHAHRKTHSPEPTITISP